MAMAVAWKKGVHFVQSTVLGVVVVPLVATRLLEYVPLDTEAM